MNASEKMAKRAVLYSRLTTIDHELQLVFGREPSNRVTAIARGLLDNRAQIADAMITVGFQPWSIPVDAMEAKVSHG